MPAEAFADAVFSSEAESRTGDVAVFNLDASSGETATVTIEADLAVSDPDEAQVQAWTDLWRERVVGLRPLDDDPPADATITPIDVTRGWRERLTSHCSVGLHVLLRVRRQP